MARAAKHVLLGFEVGTGAPVEIPLAHTFVTGQTQLSGKTTTLRAIVERSGQRALAFVTKRGESFEGRRIRPYLPREGEQPIHWRLVETILASALGQRAMKYERLWLINAVKRPRVATTLAMVRSNVTALLDKAKGNSLDAYTLIGEYLDLVLPDMRALNASDRLDLQAGLNVMDLVGVSQQLQALVIRASLEHINRHEAGVLTVFPEAWEFAPRAAAAPAKEEAIAMARKGAVLGNFLLCDSQDIAGVDTVVRQAASVWILGVQRELNELKRTIQMIPAGIKRPKAEDVATLGLGQFYACWGRHAIKTFVQPAWMNAAQAQQVADGSLDVVVAAMLSPGRGHRIDKEETVNEREAQALRDENAELKSENANLRHRIEALEQSDQRRRVGEASRSREPVLPSPAPTTGADGRPRDGDHRREFTAEQPFDNEALYQAFKARLIRDAHNDPVVLSIVLNRPELQMKIQRKTIEVSEDSTRGMVAKLIVDGFFERGQSSAATLKELQRRGRSLSPGTLYPELEKLAEMGFFTIEDGKDERSRPRKEYHLVPGMKVHVVETAGV